MTLFASLRNAVRWAGFDLGRGDGASAQAVVLVDPATGEAYSASSGSPVDREVSGSTYRVRTAFTGASVGDTITATRVLDVSGSAATQVGATIWYNESTGAGLASAPSAANLELVGSQALTDAQLRAAPLPLPTGAATAAAQTTGNTSLASIDADIGATTDAAAVSDTATASLISLTKRSLQSLTTMIGRLPALVSGRLPVDGSGVTQPVSGPVTDVQLRAAPLDTEPAYAPSGKAAVVGTFAAVGNSPAFTPIAGRSFNITRNGAGTASVRMTRSLDGGASWHPITANGVTIMAFTTPFSEQWGDDESGVQYRLECTAYTSGSVTYRISQ